MTPNTIRSFAAGLLVATGILGAVYSVSPGQAKETQTAEKPSVNEMKSSLTSKGYVVLLEEEWNQQLAAAEKKQAEANQVESTKEAEKEKVVYRTMVTVSKGMTSIDVEKALKRAKIIDSGTDFSKIVEKRHLENGLRPGTYEVDSSMTLNEILSTFFKH